MINFEQKRLEEYTIEELEEVISEQQVIIWQKQRWIEELETSVETLTKMVLELNVAWETNIALMRIKNNKNKISTILS